MLAAVPDARAQDAKLSALTIPHGNPPVTVELTPAFDPDVPRPNYTNGYQASVGNDVEMVTVTATPADPSWPETARRATGVTSWGSVCDAVEAGWRGATRATTKDRRQDDRRRVGDWVRGGVSEGDSLPGAGTRGVADVRLSSGALGARADDEPGRVAIRDGRSAAWGDEGSGLPPTGIPDGPQVVTGDGVTTLVPANRPPLPPVVPAGGSFVDGAPPECNPTATGVRKEAA